MSRFPTVVPPQSWIDPETHYLKALEGDWYRGLLALQGAITTSTVRFWAERGVPSGHLPVTTGSISSPMGLGSDSRPVAVNMFGVRTYLCDSMQFGLEYLCRLNEQGAYYLMPSFRGEQNDASHLGQFFHSEAEVPGGLEDVLTVVESYVRRLVEDIVGSNAERVRALTGGDLSHVERLRELDRFPRLRFDEAARILGDDPALVKAGEDGRWRTLTRKGERELMARHGEFLWITHWDELAVPFYQGRETGTGKALNADLLFGPGEVVGCGERHITGEEVAGALSAHHLHTTEYAWYVSLKNSWPLRTSGFGMGIERFLMWLLRHDDIRDMQIFPRQNGRDIVP